MNYKKIFWGTFLIILGILFILRQSGMIEFHVHYLIRLWPLLFIYWGISVLPLKDNLKLFISLTLLILAFVLVFYFSHKYPNRNWPFNDYRMEINSDNDDKSI